MIKFISGVLMFGLLSSGAYAGEYQYATFVEIRSESGGGEATVILSFNTDPGSPVTVMSKATSISEAARQAYQKLFDDLKWSDAKGADALYVLNRLGAMGWKVIDVDRREGTVFTSKEATKEAEYLLVLEHP